MLPKATRDQRKIIEIELTELEKHFEAELALYEKSKINLFEWAHNYRELRIGFTYKPFGLEGHEYLRELYEKPFHTMIFEKAAQMGASEYAISFALWFVDTRLSTAIYFFPTDGDVADFSNTRVGPAIEHCEHLYSQMSDINNIHLRQIGSSLLYFRGMFSKGRTKSVPADLIVFDELDEAKPSNKAQAIERMSHSPWKWKLELSTPTLPDFGIDIEWQKSDQRYWHVACGCKDGIILENVFPDCIGIRNEGSTSQEVFLRCPVCGKENLNVCEPAQIGEYRGWVPRYTEKSDDIRGYHLSQLFSTAISTSEIWTNYKNTRDIPEFYNSKLGMPYAGDRMPLTKDILLQCCGDWDLLRSGKDVFIGVDQGDELHAIVVKRDKNTGQRKIINAIVLDDSDPWPPLIEFCKNYKDFVGIVDAMPNKNDARKLCNAFPGSFFMNYYVDNQKDAINQNHNNKDEDTAYKVTSDRTETLDRVIDGFLFTVQGRKDGILLPNGQIPVINVVMDHLSALAKVKHKQTSQVNGIIQETGMSKWVYIHIKPDHFAHALNYALIAESLNIYSGFAELW